MYFNAPSSLIEEFLRLPKSKLIQKPICFLGKQIGPFLKKEGVIIIKKGIRTEGVLEDCSKILG
jgi:hypothetical protein